MKGQIWNHFQHHGWIQCSFLWSSEIPSDFLVLSKIGLVTYCSPRKVELFWDEVCHGRDKQNMLAIVGVRLNVILRRQYLFSPQIEPSVFAFWWNMTCCSKKYPVSPVFKLRFKEILAKGKQVEQYLVETRRAAVCTHTDRKYSILIDILVRSSIGRQKPSSIVDHGIWFFIKPDPFSRNVIRNCLNVLIGRSWTTLSTVMPHNYLRRPLAGNTGLIWREENDRIWNRDHRVICNQMLNTVTKKRTRFLIEVCFEGRCRSSNF
jgi:hypothetical protein